MELCLRYIIAVVALVKERVCRMNTWNIRFGESYEADISTMLSVTRRKDKVYMNETSRIRRYSKGLFDALGSDWSCADRFESRVWKTVLYCAAGIYIHISYACLFHHSRHSV